MLFRKLNQRHFYKFDIWKGKHYPIKPSNKVGISDKT